ncbi:hypothetical protein AUR66_14900 [Haloferax profundi]|uniref:Uncharacterized protein n=1 Tax=Haloferax profundi TaxID=1544718 RepID=A0A0W1SLG0_9EURY|nr:hypothetical protein AUR66_14900 [Haloferax profundi]
MHIEGSNMAAENRMNCWLEPKKHSQKSKQHSTLKRAQNDELAFSNRCIPRLPLAYCGSSDEWGSKSH